MVSNWDMYQDQIVGEIEKDCTMYYTVNLNGSYNIAVCNTNNRNLYSKLYSENGPSIKAFTLTIFKNPFGEFPKFKYRGEDIYMKKVCTLSISEFLLKGGAKNTVYDDYQDYKVLSKIKKRRSNIELHSLTNSQDFYNDTNSFRSEIDKHRKHAYLPLLFDCIESFDDPDGAKNRNKFYFILPSNPSLLYEELKIFTKDTIPNEHNTWLLNELGCLLLNIDCGQLEEYNNDIKAELLLLSWEFSLKFDTPGTLNYAFTCNNLGVAYLLKLSSDSDNNTNYVQIAIDWLKKSLHIRTISAAPFDRAITLFTLSRAYCELSNSNTLNDTKKSFTITPEISQAKHYAQEAFDILNSDECPDEFKNLRDDISHHLKILPAE